MNSLRRPIGGGTRTEPETASASGEPPHPRWALSSEVWGVTATAVCACKGSGAGEITGEARARERKRGLGLNSSSGGTACCKREPTACTTGCGTASIGFGQENGVGCVPASENDAEGTLLLSTACESMGSESTGGCGSAALGASVDETRAGLTRRSASFRALPPLMPPRPPSAPVRGAVLNDPCFVPAARRAEAPGIAVSSEPALARCAGASGGLAGSWSRCSAAMRAALQDSAPAGGPSELRGGGGAVVDEVVPAFSHPPASMGFKFDISCTESPTVIGSSDAPRAGPTSSAGGLVIGCFFPRLQKTSRVTAAAIRRQPATMPAMTGTSHARDSGDDDAGLVERTGATLLTGTGIPMRGPDAETAAGGTPLAAADAAKNAANRAPGDELFGAALLTAASPSLSCGGKAIPSAPLSKPHASTASVTTTDGEGTDTLVSALVVLAFSSKSQGAISELTALDGATSKGCGSPDVSASCAIMTVPTGTPSAQATPRRRKIPMLGAMMTDRGIPTTVTFRGTCTAKVLG